MQRVENVKRIQAEPIAETALAEKGFNPKEGNPRSGALLIVVQVVLCLCIFASIYILKQAAPDLLQQLKEQYAPILDQALLLEDSEVRVLYEE